MVPFSDKIKSNSARTLRKKRSDVPHQAIQDRIAPLECSRPGILARHDPADIIRKVVGEGRPTPTGGIIEDLLNKLFVFRCTHGVLSID
jgi:hypothetical protein